MFHTVRQIKQSHYPHPNTCSRPAEDLLINVTLWAMFSCAGECTAIDQVCFFKKKKKSWGRKTCRVIGALGVMALFTHTTLPCVVT